MKATNFKQAAQMALDERWYPMSKAKSIDEMNGIYLGTYCELCSLRNRKRDKNPLHKGECCGCLLRDSSPICCEEYGKWTNAKNIDNFPEAHKQSLLLVKRLEKIAEA